MNVALHYASLLCVAAGLVCGAVALVVSRNVPMALRVALDFWLAAGLLRLALPSAGPELLGAAAIIVVRQLVGVALRAPADRSPEHRESNLDRRP